MNLLLMTQSKSRSNRGWYHKLRWIHIKVDTKNDDESSTTQKVLKQNLILLPETHSIYYKELHSEGVSSLSTQNGAANSNLSGKKLQM